MNHSQAEIEERRKDVAFLHYSLRWTIDEIADSSDRSIKTIERDVEYIEAHPDEFFG